MKFVFVSLFDDFFTMKFQIIVFKTINFRSDYTSPRI